LAHDTLTLLEVWYNFPLLSPVSNIEVVEGPVYISPDTLARCAGPVGGTWYIETWNGSAWVKGGTDAAAMLGMPIALFVDLAWFGVLVS